MKKHQSSPSIAEFYHELTKYSPESLSSTVPDPLQKPPLFKEYLSERSVDLKPFLKGAPGSGGAATGHGGSLRPISRLLYHTGGITDIVEGRGGTIYFRAAPSAGALYPAEIYLATRGVEGLPDGIHNYSVREHALVPVWEGDFGRELEDFCFRHPAAVDPKMVLILTAVFRRSAWRYRDRAYRRILLDVGHVLGNAAAYGAVEGLSVIGLASFHDAAVSDLLFLERDEEAAFVIAHIVPRQRAEEVAVASPFPESSPRTVPPPGGGEKGVMLLLHEKSAIAPAEREGRAARPASALPADPDVERGPGINIGVGGRHEPAGEPLAASIGPVIRRRRSSRAFGKGRLALAPIAGILRSAYAPVRPYYAVGDHRVSDCLFVDPTLLSTYLLATRVDSLAPGVYRFDPVRCCLVPRRDGDFGSELWTLCLGQELGRQAAAAIFHVADLPACVERFGDRAYRYIHLDAGHLGERINLAAVAREVGVSGIGGFFDEEVNELLDLPERSCAVYITLLGPVPEAPGE